MRYRPNVCSPHPLPPMKLVTPVNLRPGIFPEKLWGAHRFGTKSSFQDRPTVLGAVGMGTMVLARCRNDTNSKFGNLRFSRFLDFASKNRGFTIFFLRLGDKITWFWYHNGGGIVTSSLLDDTRQKTLGSLSGKH